MQYIKIIEGQMPLKPVNTLIVRDWKEDIVNLVQFPRTHTVVSPSPFALKLETWLRMNNIKYHNVSNEISKASSKGQVPFIELNGRQFADSNFIIEHLRGHFKVSMDGKLTTQERADARAYSVLIEESLFRCLQYNRSKNFGWLATEDGMLPHLHRYQKFVFQKLFIKQLQSGLKKTLNAQGYGRHTADEIEEITKKDLMALSTQLGSKQFLFGDAPTTVDATLFGHLVQFTDTPLYSDKIKPFLEQDAPNLVEFVKRVKTTYWPDWAQICETLAMNPEDLVKKEEPAPVQAEKTVTEVPVVTTTETTTVVHTTAPQAQEA